MDPEAVEAIRVAAISQARAEIAAELVQAQTVNQNLEARIAASRKVKTPTAYSGSGKKDDPTLNNWVSSMEVYCRAARIVTVREQLEQAGACLSNTAVEWFNKVFWPSITPLTTWADFVAALHTRFEPVDSETTARARLNTLRQGKYSVTAYTNMFTDLIGRVGAMEEKDRYEHYTNGLRKEIGDVLRLHMVGRPQQLAVAMAIAFEIESAISRNANQPKGAWKRPDQWRRFGNNNNNNNRFNANTNAFAPGNDGPVPMELGHLRSDDHRDDDEKRDVSDNDPDDSNEAKASMSYALAAMQQQRPRGPLPKLSDADRARLRATGSCFRCRQQGHISRDCPLQYNGPKA
jgi:hypothetical protein